MDGGDYFPASDTNDLPQIIERQWAGARLKATIYNRCASKRRGDCVPDGVDDQVDASMRCDALRPLPDADDPLFQNEFVNVALLLDTLQDLVTVSVAAISDGPLSKDFDGLPAPASRAL